MRDLVEHTDFTAWGAELGPAGDVDAAVLEFAHAELARHQAAADAVRARRGEHALRVLHPIDQQQTVIQVLGGPITDMATVCHPTSHLLTIEATPGVTTWWWTSSTAANARIIVRAGARISAPLAAAHGWVVLTPTLENP